MTFETWLRSLGADEERGIIASTTRAIRPLGRTRRVSQQSSGIWPLIVALAAILAAYAFLASFTGPIPAVIVG
jgi:hypothetical protein